MVEGLWGATESQELSVMTAQVFLGAALRLADMADKGSGEGDSTQSPRLSTQSYTEYKQWPKL